VVKLPKVILDFESGSYIQIDIPECKLILKNDLYKIDDRFKEDYDKFGIWDLKMKIQNLFLESLLYGKSSSRATLFSTSDLLLPI
jgi:Na+-transporting NADH:ubiquinone oxidoreductase subunit NqrF